MANKGTEIRQFLCRYNFEGKKCAVDMWARDFQDAQRRLWAMQYGTVDDPLRMTVPIGQATGSLVKLFV